MNIDELTVGQCKEIARLIGHQAPQEQPSPMIGRYVVVRCKNAGVHAGVLESQHGQGCVLNESRRLWYWKTKEGTGDFLSGIAENGLDSDSKVGAPVRIQLTEACEIIECSSGAEKSIRRVKTHGKND